VTIRVVAAVVTERARTPPTVDGRMIVAADHFDLEARLGLIFRPFLGMIEAETRKQLDEALAKEIAKTKKQA
jgi:hypothetical protein